MFLFLSALCEALTHLVLELLAELQGDGEEHQRVVEPGHHTLHLVNMAHLEAVVVELTGGKEQGTLQIHATSTV